MKENLGIILLAATVLLAACAPHPQQTLDQKLAGATTAVDRKEILRIACIDEAKWPIYSSHYYKMAGFKTKKRMRLRYNSEVSEMKSLCRQMDDLTSPDAEEKLPPKELTSMCAKKVAEKMQKQREGGIEHAVRIRDICEKMIGHKINVKPR